MDEELYDEFGNYIGPDLDEDENNRQAVADDNEDEDSEDEWGDGAAGQGEKMQLDDGFTTLDAKAKLSTDVVVFDSNANRIVLHEDKNYYPEAGSPPFFFL